MEQDPLELPHDTVEISVQLLLEHGHWTIRRIVAVDGVDGTLLAQESHIGPLDSCNKLTGRLLVKLGAIERSFGGPF